MCVHFFGWTGEKFNFGDSYMSLNVFNSKTKCSMEIKIAKNVWNAFEIEICMNLEIVPNMKKKLDSVFCGGFFVDFFLLLLH